MFIYLLIFFTVSKDNDCLKFVPAITGGLNSNEMIIQQLEELLKTDCKLSHNEADFRKDASANRILSHGTINKTAVSSLQSDSMMMTAPSVIFSSAGMRHVTIELTMSY